MSMIGKNTNYYHSFVDSPSKQTKFAGSVLATTKDERSFHTDHQNSLQLLDVSHNHSRGVTNGGGGAPILSTVNTENQKQP